MVTHSEYEQITEQPLSYPVTVKTGACCAYIAMKSMLNYVIPTFDSVA